MTRINRTNRKYREYGILFLHRIKFILLHPIARRLALAILFIFTILRIRNWGGYEPSALFGLLTGIVSCTAAAYILSTPEERRRCLRSMRETFATLANERPDAIAWGIFCATVFIAAFENLSMPREATVQEIMEYVAIFGLLTFISCTIVRVRSLPTFIKQTCMFAAAYGTALWLIGNIGDSVYQFALANPKNVAAWLIAAAIIRMIWQVSSGGHSERSEPVIPHFGKAMFLPSATITERDLRYTAAHEAGHVLACAALGKLPADVRVAINDRPDANGVLGFLSGLRYGHRLTEKTFAEWYMLVLLAGKMGESKIGETLGSGRDYLQWLNIASLYLENQYRGVFYVNPKNKLEQEQNEAKLETLKQEQLHTLKSLFGLNVDIFMKLADALLEKRTLTRDDLFPFLARVKFPESFPMPFGAFAEFSTEWPENSCSRLPWRNEP
ncbi:MAG: hypothetical protein WAO55_13850 [Candidatus Manganitrophaceae bacterium]